MNEHERHVLFSELLVRHRGDLYGYIFAVVRNWEDADDLFQSVSLILWSKFETFRPGTNFFAWARQTARHKVSKYLRQKQHSRFVNEDLLDTLTEIAIDVNDGAEDAYLAALRDCREKLAADDQELLKLHYGSGFGTRHIADQLRRSQQSICRSLNRIRGWLLQCVQLEIARQQHSGMEHS